MKTGQLRLSSMRGKKYLKKLTEPQIPKGYHPASQHMHYGNPRMRREKEKSRKTILRNNDRKLHKVKSQEKTLILKSIVIKHEQMKCLWDDI